MSISDQGKTKHCPLYNKATPRLGTMGAYLRAMARPPTDNRDCLVLWQRTPALLLIRWAWLWSARCQTVRHT